MSEPDNRTKQPRFQLSATHSALIVRESLLVASGSALLLFSALIAANFNLNPIWLTFFCVNAAALTLFWAGLRSALDVVEWRREQTGLDRIPQGGFASWSLKIAMSPWAQKGSAHPSEIFEGEDTNHIAGFSTGLRRFYPAVMATLSCLVVYAGWSLASTKTPIGQAGLLFSAFALMFGFALLVTERKLAAINALELPEAKSLSQLARLPILVLVLSGLSLLLGARGHGGATEILAILAVFTALVGLELVLRSVLSLFRPQSADRQPYLVADSVVAATIRWPPRPLVGIETEFRSKLGIDLRQIWAFSFVRKTGPIVVTGALAFGWLLTGVREIPMSGRGIYERFGKPQRVLHSGLHLGLPWPFGQVVPIENGVVHELATSMDTTARDEQYADAEGPAPESANRLWDATHISEKSQIIASSAEGGQSLELVNMDVRFVYRIGLSDGAAMKAAYQATDIPTLIESTANRILVHDFAGRTLESVLGEKRLTLANEIASATQADVDKLESGVELLAVVVEAIHPPAGASDAYHGDQAAQIASQALVARERGTASIAMNQAEQNADVQRNDATATARENVAASETARLKFGAEQTAYHDAGQAFLTEEYFARLTAGLANSKALILDHRIGGNAPPAIDLRSAVAPVDPGIEPGPDSNTEPGHASGDEPYTPYRNEETSP